MANWFTNQKAKRLLGDMPLTKDMTGSGGAHNQNKGYSESEGPLMTSKGPHSGGHGGEKNHTHGESMTAEEFTENGVDKGGDMDLQNDGKNLPGGHGKFNRKNINAYADALTTGDSLQQVNSGKKYIEPGTTKKIYGQQGDFRDKSLTEIRDIKNSRPETPESNTDYYNSLKSIFTKVHNKGS